MSERYRYHASTNGLWGRIKEPFNEIIPVQASLSLPGTGGFGTARMERFDFHGIVSFESIEALVSGSPSRDSYDSTATVSITGLNILNVLTADKVVARIVAESRDEGPPFVTPVGSYFENLRIAGHPVQVSLHSGKFHGCDPRAGQQQAHELHKNFWDKVAALPAEKLAHLREQYSWLRSGQAATTSGAAHCSLVREIEGLEHMPDEVTRAGHIIHVRGFGLIRLAEFRITEGTQSVTMFQVELGSTPSGPIGGGGGSGGGSDP